MPSIKRKQKVIPAAEPVSNILENELKRGCCYLVKEPKPEVSFAIFASTVKGPCAECTHPEAFPCESIGCEGCTLSCPCRHCEYTRAKGLCFTVCSPEEIMQSHLLQTTSIFWISKHGNGSVSPANLGMIAAMINEFLRRSKNAVVLLEGAEYLIITNGFISVLKFLHDIREWTVLQKSVFILSVSPATLDEKELALIERNMEHIDALTTKTRTQYL